MKTLLNLILIGALLLNSGCDDDSVIPEESTIKYGTSFGFCVGYCARSLTITSSNITFDKSAWTDKENFPDLQCTESFSDWDDLTSKIDIQAFNATAETIGCPDCADGGAEWIEISSENGTHRVTFEFNDAPEVFDDYIELLRDIHENADDNCP